MVLGVEEIDREADPAGSQHEHGRNDLTHQGDGLLQDVENGNNERTTPMM